MGDQYVRHRALSLEKEASDVIDEVEEEYEWMEWGKSPEFTDKEVDLLDAEDTVLRDFQPEGEAESDGEDDYVRGRGYSRDGPSVEWTKGHEFTVRTNEVKDRLIQIEKVNTKLEEAGSDRRYVATKSDAPDNVYVYEDDFGAYYFKTGDQKLRPSDVAGINKDDSWYAYDGTEKVLKTIKALASEFPEIVEKASEVEQVYTFTDRVLKTEDEVVRDPDVFSLKEQDAVVASIVQAKGVAVSGEDLQSQ